MEIKCLLATVSLQPYATFLSVFFKLLLGLQKTNQCPAAWYYLAEAQMKIHEHRNSVLSCNQGNCLLIERTTAELCCIMYCSPCGLCVVGLN